MDIGLTNNTNGTYYLNFSTNNKCTYTELCFTYLDELGSNVLIADLKADTYRNIISQA